MLGACSVRIVSTGSEALVERLGKFQRRLEPGLNFILPGGSQGAAALHVARTVCRRAERRVWPLLLSGHQEEVIGVFLNRLSDFLFVAARLDAHSVGASEQRYKIEWRVDRWQRQIVPAD